MTASQLELRMLGDLRRFKQAGGSRDEIAAVLARVLRAACYGDEKLVKLIMEEANAARDTQS